MSALEKLRPAVLLAIRAVGVKHGVPPEITDKLLEAVLEGINPAGLDDNSGPTVTVTTSWETLTEDVRRLSVPSGWIYEVWCEDRASTSEGYSARQRAAHVFVPFAHGGRR